jgi:hypothetical protein
MIRDMLFRTPNYWIYSTGFFVVWGLVLLIVALHQASKFHQALLLFAGATIGWASGTIARYIYPPPRRWLSSPPQ